MLFQRDDSNQEILNIKNKFISLNYLNIPLDNEFNLELDATVRAFQQRLSLTKDGIIGPQTLSALKTSGPLSSPYLPIDIALKVPYLSQRDNTIAPGGTCNVTSLAMVMSYWGVKPTKAAQLEDELSMRLDEKDAQDVYHKYYPTLVAQGYKARHVHGMLGWVAKKYGFTWSYKENASFDEIRKFLDIGPIITAGSFTKSGHIVVIVGRTANKDLIIHDSAGDWNTQYKNKNGAYRVYNIEDMSKTLAGTSGNKRAHFITKQ